MKKIICLLLTFIIIYSSQASETPNYGKKVILTTVDGVKIHAIDYSIGRNIMLIYCHRLLSSKDSFHLDKFGHVFLEKFDVMTLDFRGHGESGWLSNCGGDEVLDLRVAVQYARETEHERIVLLGVGMGGIAAIRQVALFGNVDGVIAVSPCSQPDKLKPWWWNLVAYVSLTTDYGKIPIRIFSKTRIDNRYWTGSPAYLVDRVSPTPLMIVHGQSDRYLNLGQVQKLYDDAKEPKRLLLIPKKGHAEGLLNESTAKIISNWIEEILSMEKPQEVAFFDIVPIAIKEIDIRGQIVLPEDMIKDAIKASLDKCSITYESLSQIEKTVKLLHQIHGYTISKVDNIELSEDGKLSLEIRLGLIDHISFNRSKQVMNEQIKQVFQIEEGQVYNAWDIESGLKRLIKIPALTKAESHLKQENNGNNNLEIIITERNPWSFSIASHFTSYDQFGGFDVSLNEFRPGAWKGSGLFLLGLQEQDFLYQLNVQREWLRQNAFSISLGFQRYISSWDNMDYYFARQEAQKLGGYISATYKIIDNAIIHLGLSGNRFSKIDWIEALPVDEDTIGAMNMRLEKQGQVTRKSEIFLNWGSRVFFEAGTPWNKLRQRYSVLQFNVYPELILSSVQYLGLNLHVGNSFGLVPKQNLFSLGGDLTLPAYNDDAFLGEQFLLIRAKHGLKFGNWLSETSRFNPLSLNLLFDSGYIRNKNEAFNLRNLKNELGVEIQYSSIIRLGFVKGLSEDTRAFQVCFGWHPHLIRKNL